MLAGGGRFAAAFQGAREIRTKPGTPWTVHGSARSRSEFLRRPPQKLCGPSPELRNIWGYLAPALAG